MFFNVNVRLVQYLTVQLLVCDKQLWTRSVWLRIGSCGILLWARWWTFGFCKRWEGVGLAGGCSSHGVSESFRYTLSVIRAAGVEGHHIVGCPDLFFIGVHLAFWSGAADSDPSFGQWCRGFLNLD